MRRVDVLQGAASNGQVDEDGIELDGAAAFEDLNPQAWIGPRQQGQSKGGCRGLVLLGQGAKQKDRSCGQSCGQLKATNLLGGGLLWSPGQ